jgi:subtilisin family serine protease
MNKILLACLLLALLGGAGGCQMGGVKDYADVRNKDMRAAGSLDEVKIRGLWFNLATQFPAKSAQIAKDLLEQYKNPGLGTAALHAQGINGKGVTVAIIDQNLAQALDHPEFSGKIIQYRDFGTDQLPTSSSMHGPAVTSLLVGETIGTAPGARLYFAATPSWTEDAQSSADALDWLVAENAKLPEGEKIRLVSVSARFSGEGSTFKNGAAWDAAFQRATQAGMLVLDCSVNHGIVAPCYFDPADRESPGKCTPGYPGVKLSSEYTTPGAQRVFIPTSPRTTAEEYQQGEFSYQYTGQGGLSWSVPYLAGVLAMGWQLRPDLSGARMVDLVFDSAFTRPDGLKVLDPAAFIEAVNAEKQP